jgi:hypothetical protein
VIPNPNDPGHRLAMILQSIDREENEFAKDKLEHKSRIENLRNEAWKLRQQIITGQEELPLEPVPPPAEPPTEQAA